MDSLVSCWQSLLFPDSQGQADLLKHAKSEALDTLRQIHCAAQSCGLSKNEAASPQEQHHPQQQLQHLQQLPQLQIQQQATAKALSQPTSLYQAQPQTTPQAYTQLLPQQHPLLPAHTLVQTVLKPPAYPHPPPLPQGPLPPQGPQQRAAGPLDVIPQREVASDNPPGSCWPAACAHREYCPGRDTETRREEKGVAGEQQAKEVEEMAERIREMMTLRKARRTRSETQVWDASFGPGAERTPTSSPQRLLFFES